MDKESDTDGILRKALAINEIPEDFDPNKTPQTGEEYIHYVMYEAKQCKEWVKAEIPQEILKNTPPNVFYEPTGCISAPEEFLPSLEWQQRQIADFSAFRLHIQKLKQQNGEVSSQFNGEIQQWRKKCANEPKLSDLLVLNQKSLCKILNYMLEWLNETPENESLSYANGVWLYAILSCLETPLMPENCSILREIARKCSEIRSKLDKSSSEELYRPLNVFICVIGRYFNNHDLIDNVNEL